MRLAPLFLTLTLAACHAPSPSMRHAWVARQQVSVDGAIWRVDWNGDEAEAHRLNFDTRIARGPMVMRGAAAIMVVTGCYLRPGTLRGDQAIVRAGTDCGQERIVPLTAPPPLQIACILDDIEPGSFAPEAVLNLCLLDQ